MFCESDWDLLHGTHLPLSTGGYLVDDRYIDIALTGKSCPSVAEWGFVGDASNHEEYVRQFCSPRRINRPHRQSQRGEKKLGVDSGDEISNWSEPSFCTNG